jgi:hypothetical protein
MVSCDTCITVPVGNRRRSQPAICSGDQRSSSLSSTMARSPGRRPSFVCFGRQARPQAARSAVSARYWRRPPLPATSRDTVDGARPSTPAIVRSDRPAARPREISSRSANESRNSHRRRGTGRIPPVRLSRSRTVDGFTRICRASTFTASPDRQRRHTSSTSAEDSPFRAIRHHPSLRRRRRS